MDWLCDVKKAPYESNYLASCCSLIIYISISTSKMKCCIWSWLNKSFSVLFIRRISLEDTIFLHRLVVAFKEIVSMVFYIASLCARMSFSSLKDREWYIHMQWLGNSNEYLFLLSTWIFFSFIFEESIAYNQAYSIYKNLYLYIPSYYICKYDIVCLLLHNRPIMIHLEEKTGSSFATLKLFSGFPGWN